MCILTALMEQGLNSSFAALTLVFLLQVRVSHEHDHFLLNPFGMLYHEITASSLVKVHLNGQIVDMGSTTLGINLAGYLLHSAIHGARPDIMCVIHFHTGPCAAVSSTFSSSQLTTNCLGYV